MKIAVTTIAFSKNQYLVDKLSNISPHIKINKKGIRFNSKQLVEFLSEAEIAIVGLDLINEKILDQLPKLKAIIKYGVGVDNIDLKACKKRNIFIGWKGGVNKKEVAEITLGFMISLSRNTFNSSLKLRKGIWDKNGGKSISELMIGIIGIGNIGKEVIKMLKFFEVKIIANDIINKKKYCAKNKIKFVEKDFLYKNSDIISIHTPLNHSTHNLINKQTIALMKKAPYIINTARGGIINEIDLLEAVNKNLIKGAALDVFEKEPLCNKAIYESEQIICTPHISGNSALAINKMGLSAIKFVKTYYNEK